MMQATSDSCLSCPSNIEILREPYDEAASLECTLSGKNVRVLGEYTWLTWLRNETGNDRLFVAFWPETESFVLCAWIYAPGEEGPDICREVEPLDGVPTQSWPFVMHPDLMVLRLRPSRRQVFREAAQERDQARKAYYHSNREHKKEMVRHYQRKGQTDIAASLHSQPLVAPQNIENLDEKVEMYGNLMKNG